MPNLWEQQHLTSRRSLHVQRIRTTKGTRGVNFLPRADDYTVLGCAGEWL